jgi:hypothetical protein
MWCSHIRCPAAEAVRNLRQHVESQAADPDPHPGADPVKAQPLRGGDAEHRDRLAGGGGVQVAALGTVPMASPLAGEDAW